ncbi:hypothetical protein, partial [Leifsonia sp. NPDC058248]|uniref:hypothetical protein n=1 Tax=Leifsonia sp. NPDC058248 TaxID=3346402 RepID=UPI0036DBBB48
RLEAPASDLKLIQEHAGITVVKIAAAMAIVEADEDTVKQLMGDLPGWALGTGARFHPAGSQAGSE